MSLFWQVARIYKLSALLLFFLMLAGAFSEILGLGIVVPLLELIVNSGDASKGSLRYMQPILQHFPEYYHLLVLGGLMALLILVKNVILIIRTGYSSFFAFRFRKMWQSAILENYMFADYGRLLDQKQGVVLNNLLIEPSRAARALEGIIDLASRAILALSLFALLLVVDWRVTLLLVAAAVGLILVLRRATDGYAAGVGKKRVSLSQQVAAIGAESIAAVRQIKIFSFEETVLQRFVATLGAFMRLLVRFDIVRALPKATMESLVMVGVVLILLYLRYVSEVNLVQAIPIVALFIVTAQRFFPVVSGLFVERMRVLATIPSLRLVHHLYSSPMDKERINRGLVVQHLDGDILFERVHFRYSGSNLLFRDLSLRIPKGKVTAIVGPSGAGKSTVVDLLVGLFECQSGRIVVNSHDLRNVNLRSWRKLIGYVSQDTFLFNSTISDNIAVGKPEATMKEVVGAAKKANADAFIGELPEGYNTVVGDRGVKLSGGQKQRIAIARVMIRNPQLLIFDEATNSLDAEAEGEVLRSIEKVGKDRTSIIITHRVSSVRNADLIYFLEKGHIVDFGQFEELESRRTQFYQISRNYSSK